MSEEAAGRSFRRLQRVGRGTYSISLPKRWVLARGLRPGDLLELVEELDGALRVAPVEVRPRYFSCTINADLCRDSGRLANLIRSSYRAGYDAIRLVFSPGSGHDLVRDLDELLRELPGLELARETDGEIELRHILDYGRYTVDDLLKRSQMLLSAIFSNLMDFLETRRYELIPYIRELSNRLGELRNLFTRLVVTYLKRREIGRFLRLRSATHLHSSIILMDVMEEVADELMDLRDSLLRLRKRIWADPRFCNTLRGLLEYGSQLLDEALNAYFTLDLDKACRVLELPEDELSSTLDEVVREKSPRDYEFNLFAARASIFLRNLMRRCRQVSQLVLDEFVEHENLVCRIEERI